MCYAKNVFVGTPDRMAGSARKHLPSGPRKLVDLKFEPFWRESRLILMRRDGRDELRLKD